MATDKAGSGGAGAAAALKSASKAASYNAVLQITFRVATFVMNAVIIRQTSREMLGLVNVRLALLWSTILFIAREALRKTCLGAKVGPEGGDNGWIGLLNLMWLGVPLGIAASLGLSYVWLSVLSAPDDPGYPLAVCAFALSAVLELVVEPLWLLAQSLLYVKLKVLAEGCALGIRCGVTIALLLWRPELGLAAFCVAQLAYAVTLISVYYVYLLREAAAGNLAMIRSWRDFCPRGVGGKPWFLSYPRHLFDLTVNFLQQSLLKQFLTEGERYLMTFANAVSLADQGVYDIITNLGALAARFIFQPIEENFYTLFASLLERSDAPSVALSAARRSNEVLASRTLRVLLQLVLLIGVTIAVFGQAYSFLLLDIYGGAALSGGQGPTLLKVYCCYTFFLALNGMTECFAFAAMRQDQVQQHSRWMVLFSAVFVAASYGFTQLAGSVGFVLANTSNMLVRIVKSSHTIVQFAKTRPHTCTEGHPLWGAVPGWRVLAAYAMAYVATSASEHRFSGPSATLAHRAAHVGIGAVSLLVVLGVVFLTERRFLAELRGVWRGDTHAKKE